MSSTTYPVRVEAHLDPGLSRVLWLFKWFLALPHYLVLLFLWPAFFVLSVVAFFAILATGRYPRSLFDFNVGVLRWSWRVAYYSYGALGTDDYPPFTLHDVPAYPAHLDVEYPAHLSRGLVLVKWWLLAIPHYLIVSLLVGGAGYAVQQGSDDTVARGAGLIGLLVLVAGVLVLFTGRYPQQLFDFILGLNRWVLRVAGYAALMTDRYPPFRLDQGGDDAGLGMPADVSIPPSGMSPPAPPAPPSTPTGPSGWTVPRVISLAIGADFALLSLGAGVGGAVLALADVGARDGDGFLMSPAEEFATSTYAIASSSLEVQSDAPADLLPEALLGDAKFTAIALSGGEVFLGIAPTTEVENYLNGVAHARLSEFLDRRAAYETIEGSAPSAAPGAMSFWTSQSSGAGQQEITFPVEEGAWTIVVMNTDASARVAVRATVGAELPATTWLIGILLTIAGVALVLAVILVTVPVIAVSGNRQHAG